MRLQEIIDDAIEELRERLKDFPNEDTETTIHEIADCAVPIMNYDLMELGADNLELAITESEIGFGFDGTPTAVNIMAARIYEEICEALHSNLSGLREEIEEEAEDE